MNPRRLIVLCLSLSTGCLSSARAEGTTLQEAVTAFQDHRWIPAMEGFIEVLKKDPQNHAAHEYLNLIAQELSSERKALAQDQRLLILSEASKKLESNRQDARPIDKAILDSTQSAAFDRDARTREQCQSAMIQAHLGNLASANDLVLSILMNDPANMAAVKALSDLQSDLRSALDHGKLTPAERSVYEGYYAYGQAEYEQAVSAWGKARETLAQDHTPNQVHDMVINFRFANYERMAQAHLNDEAQTVKEQSTFNEAVDLYNASHYSEAMQKFGQIALLNPEYPQLSNYLVKTEAAVEEERTKSLSDAKRKAADVAFAKGVEKLEQSKYKEAGDSFNKVLAVDPSHPKAQAYLSYTQEAIQQKTDPAGAEKHYEAGLIAYASVNVEEASREWRIALNLDPGNEKVTKALLKAQKELALAKVMP